MINSGMTRRNIRPVKGQGAFLPNQPKLHTCVVTSTADAPLYAGDVVTLDTDTNLQDLIVVKKAAETDKPFGIVSFDSIKNTYNANDRISIYPRGSYVYMPTGAPNIKPYTKVGIDANGAVIEATAGNGVLGDAITSGVVTDDIIAVQVLPDVVAAG